jgi:Ca2+-binding RTX toxin-like protein
MIFRSSIDVAELTNPRDQIKVFVDGDPLPKEKFRVIAQSNAIDLKLSPDIDPAASVTAVVDKVSTGRLDLTEKRIEEITLNETPQSGHLWTLRLSDSDGKVLSTYVSGTINGTDTQSSIASEVAAEFGLVPNFAVFSDGNKIQLVRSTVDNEDFSVSLIVESSTATRAEDLDSVLSNDNNLKNTYEIDHILKGNETLEILSDSNRLVEGVDYFVDVRSTAVTPFEERRTVKIAFSGRFNFYTNTDINWSISERLSEEVEIGSVTISDNDFVNASGSDMGIQVLTGAGRDLIIGGLGSDVIRSGRGQDLIFGRAGDDTIYSEDPDQSVPDNDVIFGDDGEVSLKGVRSELIVNSRGFDVFDLPDGDFIYNSLKSNTFEVGGNDNINAGNGDNIIIAGLGADEITSGNGMDVIVGDRGWVELYRELPVLIKSSDTVDIGNNADEIFAGDGDNIIIGGLDADLINSGDGDDIVLGGNGEITMRYNFRDGTINLDEENGIIKGLDTLDGVNVYDLGGGDNRQE